MPTKDNELDTLRAQAEELGLEFLDEITDDMFDTDLIQGLAVDWARSSCVLPVRRRGELCLLVADPTEVSKQEDVALLVGAELRPVLAPRSVILRGIERCYFSKRDSAEDFLRDMRAESPERAPEVRRRSDDLLQVAEEAPVTQLVNLIMLEAVKARASDIHFEPFESALRVRYRIDGLLYEQTSPPKHMEQALVSRLKVMAHMDIAEKRLPQDGMARVRVGERQIDIRASTIPVAEGERVVLRLLNRDSSLLPLTDLGMPAAMLRSFEEVLRESHGLVLVCGPTGSGKTTTLYAAIRQLDTVGKNIITIEEPVEYQLPDIGQMQVKPKIGLTFARGLRHILRQDPDVVLVGETRDAETAEIAVRASLTGHLVFTTLHTNDAPSAVIRMMDMGVEPYLLAAALRASLAQRLVRRLCPACRASAQAAEADLASLGAAGARVRGRTVWTPRGCSACLSGYRGRLGLFELLVVDDEMQDIMRRGAAEAKSIRTSASGSRVPTLLDDGVAKVLAGETSLAEVLYALGHLGA